MIQTSYPSVHLDLSAEAMMLIDAQLGEHHKPSSVRQTVRLPVIVLVLLMLLPGAPIVHESGFRQLARALECTSRRNKATVHGSIEHPGALSCPQGGTPQ